MISRNITQTNKYAKKIAKKLKGGEVIGLIGDLGSGKTVFTQALGKALGVKENITSPTFVILKEYPIIQSSSHPIVRSLIHIDAYRIKTLADIESIGIKDYFNRKDVVVIIEWADKIKKILPKNIIYINFKFINEKTRKISSF